MNRWRAIASDLLLVVGAALIVTGGFAIAREVGLFVAGGTAIGLAALLQLGADAQ